MNSINLNQNKVIVLAGYDNTTTNITLASGHGAMLPDVSIPYNLIWWNSTDYLSPTDDPSVEIVKCIAKFGDTLIVMRSQQQTLASSKNIPGKLYNMAYLPDNNLDTNLNTNLETLSYYNIPQTHGKTKHDATTIDGGTVLPIGQLPTHGIGAHTGTIGTWANIDKTTSSIADIATKSHTSLTDIGTNAHTTIDTAILNSMTHIGASVAHNTSSNIVGISDTQTLTNKTLTSPFISTIYGSSVANDDITIEGTSNATKTSSYVILQPTSGNVGIGTITPNARLQVNGSLSLPVVTKTSGYTLTISDYLCLCNAVSGAFTITLPATSGIAGWIYQIKKIDSSTNIVTVDGNASETIDGALTFSITSQYDSITVQTDGTNWYII